MNSVLLTLSKAGGDATTTRRIFDPSKFINLRETTASNVPALIFKYDDQPGSSSLTEYVTAPLTVAELLEKINNTSPSGNLAFVGRINYVSGFTVGDHDVLDLTGNPITLPVNTRVWEGYYEVITSFTSAASTATVSLGIDTDDAAAILAETAINDANKLDAAAPKAIIPLGTIGSVSEKTTAARKLSYTVGVETITDGDMMIFIQCITGL